LLRRDSPIGAMQMNKSPDIASQAMAEPGTSISGGIWPSLNATLVWALAQVNGEMAWDEWKKNTLARHAEVYPDIWYNTWSGPDTLNSTVSKHPGETVNSGFLRYTDFPIGNLHSHACTLYSAAKLLGLEFTEAVWIWRRACRWNRIASIRRWWGWSKGRRAMRVGTRHRRRASGASFLSCRTMKRAG
jgi:hypothetical protein